MRNTRLLVAVAVTASLVAGGSWAGDREGPKQLAVVSAAPDLVNENLTLTGVNFGAGDVDLLVRQPGRRQVVG